MNGKKIVAAFLCLLLAVGAVGGAAADDVNILERMGESVINVLYKLIGDGSDTAYAANWAELKLAAMQGKTDIIITGDISYGEDQGTIVFSAPVTLHAPEGEHYTIDGGGNTQIICVQGEDSNTALEGITRVIDLTFQNANALYVHSDVYGTGAGGALFVMGDLRAENCTFTANTAYYGAALCTHGNATLENCTINANMAVIAGAVYALNGKITLTDSAVGNNLAQQYGGGLYAHNGTVQLSNSAVTSNVAEYGAGVYAQNGDVEVSGTSEMTGNAASYSGSAIYAGNGSVRMYGGTIANNTAAYGAVYMDIGTGSFTGGEIRDNEAEYGGGVYSQSGVVAMGEGFAITGNTAQVSGGAVYCHEGSVTISGAVIANNTALYGGAVYSDSGSVEISSGTVLGNQAEFGGAFYLTGGTLVVNGGVIRGNTAATSGGAAYIDMGMVQIMGGRIRNNLAVYGGAVMANAGDIYVLAGIVSGNEATLGGALYTATGKIIVNGGRVAANTAIESGGGAYTESGTVSDNADGIFGNSPDNIAQP